MSLVFDPQSSCLQTIGQLNSPSFRADLRKGFMAHADVTFVTQNILNIQSVPTDLQIHTAILQLLFFSGIATDF